MMDGMMIRKAEAEDVRQISEICVEDWQKAYRGIVDSEWLDSMSVDKQYEKEIKSLNDRAEALDPVKALEKRKGEAGSAGVSGNP